MISLKFTRQVSQYRMEYGSDMISAMELLDTFNAYIQQTTQENQVFGDSYSKMWTMWCDIEQDIREGDKIVYNGIVFYVKGVQYFNNGINKHIETLLQKDDDTFSDISL